MANLPQTQGAEARPGGGMAGSFRLLRIFGFDVYIHWSWLIIFALSTWTVATQHLPTVFEEWTARQRWAIGAITTVLFFASVVAHELSHSLQARRRGVPVHNITLFLFGGVSALGGEARRARDEFWIAIVGPLTSFAAAGLFFVIWLAVRDADLPAVKAVAAYLAYINVSVGVFNLLPGFPLDGGRVLRSVLWGVKHNMLEATRIAGNVGRGVAGLMIGVGVLSMFGGGVSGGFWLILIGLFLWNAAEGAYQQLLVQISLRGLVVGPLVDRDVPRIPPDATLRQLAYDYILRRHRRAFFVAPAAEGDILGLVTLSDLRKVPEEEWDRVTVYRAMTPRERLITATPRTEAMAALQMMGEHDIHQIPIIDGR